MKRALQAKDFEKYLVPVEGWSPPGPPLATEAPARQSNNDDLVLELMESLEKSQRAQAETQKVVEECLRLNAENQKSVETLAAFVMKLSECSRDTEVQTAEVSAWAERASLKMAKMDLDLIAQSKRLDRHVKNAAQNHKRLKSKVSEVEGNLAKAVSQIAEVYTIVKGVLDRLSGVVVNNAVLSTLKRKSHPTNL